jgi:hypothetical protein
MKHIDAIFTVALSLSHALACDTRRSYTMNCVYSYSQVLFFPYRNSFQVWALDNYTSREYEDMSLIIS